MDEIDEEYEANISTFRAQAIELDEKIGDIFLEWFEAQPLDDGSQRANVMTAIQIVHSHTMAAAIWSAYMPNQLLPEDIAQAAGAAYTDLLEDALNKLRANAHLIGDPSTTH